MPADVFARFFAVLQAELEIAMLDMLLWSLYGGWDSAAMSN